MHFGSRAFQIEATARAKALRREPVYDCEWASVARTEKRGGK